MGYFGTTLARSWYIADDPPSYPDLGSQLEWLFLLFSDRNRVRAAGLYAAYHQCRSQITDDGSVLESLEQQHYNMQCSVTPIHRLPAEIMMEIFHIVLDVGQLRAGLMLVCKRWCNMIEGMASIWNSLDLGAGVTPEGVQRLLSRAGTHPLLVKIDINKAGSTPERLQPSLAMACNKASQWKTLTIASLPQDEPDALLSIQLQPMKQLKQLIITESVLSPLLRSLLQNVATVAEGTLTSMEIHCFPAVQYLLQPAHSSIYCSLTTFIAKVPKVNQPVDLLPHFMQLEVLELTNLLLAITDSGTPLPLSDTLHHLYLKSVPIHWMGGRVFSQLDNCTIIAPLTGPSPHHDVQLPACTTLHFENWDTSPIGQFFAPVLDHMTGNSNAWSPYTGNDQVVQLVRAGFGIGMQPKSVSLSVSCTQKVLVAVLQLLPELVELKLDLPRPSALGKYFFTELLAKPGNQLGNKLKSDWRELFRENRTGWMCTLCPSLRFLELKYQQWLRPGHNEDFLPPLLALSWSREKAATPFQLHVYYKTSMHSWESLNPTQPEVREALSCLRIPQNGQVTQLSLKTDVWRSAVFEHVLFAPFLYHLQVLEMTNFTVTKRQVLNVLTSFHELRELTLSSVHVPPFARDFDPPLVHTLRKLSLSNSTIAWMDGLVFTKLQRFEVDERGWPDTFERKVEMPACTFIVFRQDTLRELPALQSNFHLPVLHTCEFLSIWDHSGYDHRGITTLQGIRAKVLRFLISDEYRTILEVLEPKDEVEDLELFLYEPVSFRTADDIFSWLCETNHLGKLPCLNMRVLKLWFVRLEAAERRRVSSLCRWMLETRRIAGYSLETCYIWWDYHDWNKAASLVAVMGNEEVEIQE